MMRLEPQALVQAAKIISKNSNPCIWHLLHCHISTIWFIQYTLQECITFPSCFWIYAKGRLNQTNFKSSKGVFLSAGWFNGCFHVHRNMLVIPERWRTLSLGQAMKASNFGGLGPWTPKIQDFESLLIYPICNKKIYILGTCRHPSRKIQHRPL